MARAGRGVQHTVRNQMDSSNASDLQSSGQNCPVGAARQGQKVHATGSALCKANLMLWWKCSSSRAISNQREAWAGHSPCLPPHTRLCSWAVSTYLSGRLRPRSRTSRWPHGELSGCPGGTSLPCKTGEKHLAEMGLRCLLAPAEELKCCFCMEKFRVESHARGALQNWAFPCAAQLCVCCSHSGIGF